MTQVETDRSREGRQQVRSIRWTDRDGYGRAAEGTVVEVPGGKGKRE